MARNPVIVDIAWDVINKLIKDCQNTPYLWGKELDIQIELASRLQMILRDLGKGEVQANYSSAIKGYENQLWNRVNCEPGIKYTYSDGKAYTCHPDLIIWDDMLDKNAPPADWSDWPILFALELKYFAKPSHDNWDIKKLKYLIDQGKIKYGCWLNIRRERSKKGNGIEWEQLQKNLWSCNAYLPANDF